MMYMRTEWAVGQTGSVQCTCWQAKVPELGAGPVRIFGVTLTGLQLPLGYVRAECVVDRVRLGHSTHWFAEEEGQSKLINYSSET